MVYLWCPAYPKNKHMQFYLFIMLQQMTGYPSDTRRYMLKTNTYTLVHDTKEAARVSALHAWADSFFDLEYMSFRLNIKKWNIRNIQLPVILPWAMVAAIMA